MGIKKLIIYIFLLTLFFFLGMYTHDINNKYKCSTLNFCKGNIVEPNDLADKYGFDVRGTVVDIEYKPYGNMLVVDTGEGELQKLHETYFKFKTPQFTIITQQEMDNISKYLIPKTDINVIVTSNYSNYSSTYQRQIRLSKGIINGSINATELKDLSKNMSYFIKDNWNSLLQDSYIENTEIRNVVLYHSYVRDSTIYNSFVLEGSYDNVTFENTRIENARIYNKKE